LFTMLEGFPAELELHFKIPAGRYVDPRFHQWVSGRTDVHLQCPGNHSAQVERSIRASHGFERLRANGDQRPGERLATCGSDSAPIDSHAARVGRRWYGGRSARRLSDGQRGRQAQDSYARCDLVWSLHVVSPLFGRNLDEDIGSAADRSGTKSD